MLVKQYYFFNDIFISQSKWSRNINRWQLMRNLNMSGSGSSSGFYIWEEKTKIGIDKRKDI